MIPQNVLQHYGKGLLSAILLFVMLFCGGMLSGCKHPGAIHTYDYLNRYDRMTGEYDPPLSLVYIAPEADLDVYDVAIVDALEPGENWISNPETVAGYCIFFRHTLARELLERTDFQHISLDPEYKTDQPTLTITGKITLFKRGSGTMRFFSWFLPFLQKGGATDLQIEGRIRDKNTGDVLVEFADRRRMLGNTPWGPTWRTLDDEWTMKQTLWESARAIANFMVVTRNSKKHPPK